MENSYHTNSVTYDRSLLLKDMLYYFDRNFFTLVGVVAAGVILLGGYSFINEHVKEANNSQVERTEEIGHLDDRISNNLFDYKIS